MLQILCFVAFSHRRTEIKSRCAAHAQASQRDRVPTGPSPNGTMSQRDLVAVRLKTLYGAAQPRHAVAAPPGTACPLTALAAAEIAADRV